MIDELILMRYLAGDCSPVERKEVEQWITVEKTNAERFFELERIWNLKDELRFSDKKELSVAYDRLINRVERKEKTMPLHRLTLFSKWLGYTAAVVLLGLLSLPLFFHSAPKEVALNILEVPRGQRVALTLSDGTRVWVNSGSKLTYPSDFTTSSRKVRLEGEAYFEVRHNEQSPFIVESPLIDVKVLGTTFNVRAYKEEETSVTLAKGKVEVSPAAAKSTASTAGPVFEKIVLKPRQQVIYSLQEGITLTNDVDISNLKNWVSGQFFFRDQPLARITKELERRFDVRILIQDTVLAQEVFTCHTRSGASLDQILEILKETRRMNYVKKEKTILVLTPQNKLPMRK